MATQDQHDLGRVFNEVPELYDRVRPAYPDELFADLVAITGMNERSLVLEVGCGTGQATRSLAALGCTVTAVEPGEGMAALACRTARSLQQRRGRDVGVRGLGRPRTTLSMSLWLLPTWHWVNPSIGWAKAHDVLKPGGWMALLGNVVVRRSGEPEVYAGNRRSPRSVLAR